MFFDLKFFWPEIFFWPKIFFDQTIFLTQKNFDPKKFFDLKIFFDPKIFVDQKKIGTLNLLFGQKNLRPKIYIWPKQIFDTIFFSTLSFFLQLFQFV